MGIGKNKGRVQRTRRSVINDDDGPHAFSPHEVRLIDTVEYQEKAISIFEMMKQGYRPNEIFASLMIDDPEISEKKFVALLKCAYKYADVAVHKDREYTFQLHMERYEQLFKESMEMVDSWKRPLDPKKDWHIMVAKYGNAMKALRHQENLMGLHDKSFVVEVNENKATIIHKEETNTLPGYNLDALSLEEKVELLSLIRESRTVPIEGMHKVTIRKTVVEITQGEVNISKKDIDVENVQTIDVEFEDMPKEVISKFEDITPAPKTKTKLIEKALVENVVDGRSEEAKKHVSKGLEQLKFFKKSLKRE